MQIDELSIDELKLIIEWGERWAGCVGGQANTLHQLVGFLKNIDASNLPEGLGPPPVEAVMEREKAAEKEFDRRKYLMYPITAKIIQVMQATEIKRMVESTQPKKEGT